ncbi:MAG TPA: sulfite exporter TauE/SafE family protein [Dehalococcoidia bacterium]|nr:sulfite exporter TauE/SafE family protein [Dehalococcoidia bacterium]
MDLPEAALLIAAAFIAGAINAAAGGGTLISFPALLLAGYSTKLANVTNRIALLPGYFGGSVAYREELRRQPQNLIAVLGPTVVGALAGSFILLWTPDSAFDVIVPFLVLGACALLWFQEQVSLLFKAREDGRPNLPLLGVSIFLASVYGAYFGGGLGIVVLAILGVLLPDDIQRSNALKGIIALIVTTLAAVYFAAFADVAWSAAGVMALASFAGGYTGAGIARRMKPRTLRTGVIIYGVIVAVVLFVRLFT